MSLIRDTAETFEGEAKRIVWLPSITLAYIFTLSGFQVDFLLAVVGIVGGRFFFDLVSILEEISEGEEERSVRPIRSIRKNSSNTMIVGALLIIGGYGISIVYGLFRLFIYFTHEDVVLVGLAVVYWGILLIVFINSFRALPPTPTD